jgi:hypothetical protein
MHNHTPRRHPGLLLAGSVLVIGSACSKGADQRAAADAGTSTAAISADTSGSTASTTGRDTSATPAPAPSDNTGSSTATGSDRTSQARTSSAPVAATVKPRVRPNIDPGRVSTKPKTSSAAATPPTSPATASDTASAASGGSDSAQSQVPSSGQQGQDLKYDAASNTVTFQLIGGPRGFQFNGYSSGGATLTLPPKANVVINFVNKDGTPHSAEVISGEGPIPNAGGDPALPRAFTNQLLQGLPQEGTDNMKFTMPASGSYRVFCGVPGHGLSGMWIWMKVDPAAKAPSFGATKS